MISLKSYSVKNFKGFDLCEEIAAQNINILTGINSGGKTSLIHVLLFLKELVIRPQSEIRFNGRYIKLGNFEEVVHQRKVDQEIKIEVNLSFSKDDGSTLSEDETLMFSEINSYLIENLVELEKIDQLDLRIELGFCQKDQEIILSDYKVQLKNEEVSETLQLKYNKDLDGYKIHRTPLTLFPTLLSEAGFSIQKMESINLAEATRKIFDLLDELESAEDLKMRFDGNVFPKECYRQDEKKGYTINKVFTDYIKQVLHKFCSKIYYVGPVRVEPQLLYNYNDENDIDEMKMNPRGDSAIYIYHQIKDQLVDFVIPPQQGEVDFHLENCTACTFKEILSKWANYILGIESTYNTNQKGVKSYELRMNNDLITNVGFGSSQLFPILIEGIRQKNGVLILEQPEIHLHPNAQTRLIDFLIAIAKYNRLKLIVETHSVHMINRMVRRMVEDPWVHSNVEVLFINVKEKDGKIKKLVYDELGTVEEWPENFLTQTGIREAKYLYRAQRKKSLELEE